MADTKIEWSEKVWNPATGCTKVSAGCANCYAETLSARLKAMGQEKYENGFEYTEHPKYVEEPITWKKPRRIFVNSMSDLFHENATEKFLHSVFKTMRKADWHTYQILTKRPNRMRDYFARNWMYNGGEKREIPGHIWIGTSVENAAQTNRIGTLQRIGAHTRFVSFEPLIGDIGKINLTGIKWAIIGGESGRGHRPVRKEWITNIIEQCRKYGTAVFFKQWGGITPKAGGNTIDGKKYEEYP